MPDANGRFRGTGTLPAIPWHTNKTEEDAMPAPHNDAFSQIVSRMTRDFFEENTAALLAYGRGRAWPSAEDKAEAKRRIAKLSDEELTAASERVAEADAKRCHECGRDYEE